jgi:ribosomal protein L11 methyltransferase
VIELVLRAPEALVELVSDALVEDWGALAVTVEDADAGTGAERALFGEPGMPVPAAGWSRSTLRALFENEAAADAGAAQLLAHDWGLGPGAGGIHVQAMQTVPDEDWVRVTQAQFAPVAITPAFWIVPSWHEPPAGAKEVIRLDPGLAFGTGTHPTTRMCLRWLAERPHAAWPRVLDYGCGSGILAIAAAKLGAVQVDAVDIDPAAVGATRHNAQTNRVVLREGLPDTVVGPYNLVLANILATPLKLLAPLLGGLVLEGGWLIMAGILERQADELKAAYAPWLRIDVLAQDDGWVLMGGQRTPMPSAAAAPPAGAGT